MILAYCLDGTVRVDASCGCGGNLRNDRSVFISVFSHLYVASEKISFASKTIVKSKQMECQSLFAFLHIIYYCAERI